MRTARTTVADLVALRRPSSKTSESAGKPPRSLHLIETCHHWGRHFRGSERINYNCVHVVLFYSLCTIQLLVADMHCSVKIAVFGGKGFRVSSQKRKFGNGILLNVAYGQPYARERSGFPQRWSQKGTVFLNIGLVLRAHRASRTTAR